MKKLSVLLLLLIAASTFAQKAEDIKAIKSMCGCYEVKFNFAETFNYSKDSANYKPSKVKHDYGLEWVELVEDSPKKIVLQHLLIVGKDAIVKHWRQDWLYENTNIYDYNGFNDWNFVELSQKNVKGQWTQKVYQVDDSPRYEGSASWVHADNRHYWENTTNAPLPRREHTKRSDYNILKRTNFHEIVTNGWIHDQDNDKIVRDSAGKDFVLAQEKGHDTYTKVADSKCIAAQNWWKENNMIWTKVRAKWNKELTKNKNIKLKKEVNDKPLHSHLFALKPAASQEDVDKIIDSFIEVN